MPCPQGKMAWLRGEKSETGGKRGREAGISLSRLCQKSILILLIAMKKMKF